MSEVRHCPDCGAELPAQAPAGQCPLCLLKAGFESTPPSQVPIAETTPSPASSRFEPPSVEQLAPLFPQLELLEPIGKGGMGAVYKARQKGLDRFVAVKILPPEVGRDPAFAERFTREARAMARLSHPHIVAIHDFGQSGGQFYFVMEYVDGANLRQVQENKQLTPTEALAIVPQICDALQYAHDEGVVHRDVKPENILLDKRGRVKIADFGLSKLLREDHPDVSLTGTHQVMGTLRYMAPEQLQGTRSVDHRADIYSLGVVFYELLTGQLPMGRFDPPSKKVQVDVRLDEVVLRALEQEPEKRYQHASDVKTELEAVRAMSAAAREKTVPSVGAARDGGTPITQIRFAVDDSSDVARLAKFHFASKGYRLIEERPGTCVFQRGKKWAGLWSVELREYYTTLTVRTEPIADRKAWVSCDWSIRTMGAWVTRRDISTLEAEGRELASLLHATVEPDSGSLPAVGEPRVARPRAGVAELAAVCLGLTILVPILLYMFTRDLAQAKTVLLLGVIITIVLGLVSFKHHLGRYAALLAVVVLGAFSAVQLYDNYRKTPITYPWYGDTGFIETADGPALSEFMRAKLGIPAAQQKAADRIFQDYYRQFMKLERQHTTHTRDADGKVRITIVPFADEMQMLVRELQAELGGVVSQAVAPTRLEKGQVHSQLGLFRHAGEATVNVALWKQSAPDREPYRFKEEIAWINGGNQSHGASGRDATVFPERYRIFWVEPSDGARAATAVDVSSNNPPVAPTPSADVAYFDGHTAEVQDVVVTNDGRTVVSAGTDGKIIARDLSGKVLGTAVSPLAEKQPSIAWLTSLAVTSSGSDVYAGGTKGVLHAKIGETGPARLFLPTADPVRFITMFDEGNKLASVDASEIKFHDLRNEKALGGAPLRPEGSTGYVRNAAASSDGGYVAVHLVEKVGDGDEDYKLKVFDADDHGAVKLSYHFLSYSEFAFSRTAFAGDRTLMLCLPSGQIRKWKLDDAGKWQAELTVVRITPGGVTAAAASRDGKIIYVAREKRIVGIDAASGKSVVVADLEVGRQLGNHISSWINALAATDQPHQVAAALWDGRVAVAKCVPFPDAPPATPVAAGPATMIADKSQLPAAGQPGREDFAFVFRAPPGHVVTVWLESWENGKLTIPEQFSERFAPGKGKPLDATLRLVTQEGKVVNPDLDGKLRFDWVLAAGKADLGTARSVWLKSPQVPFTPPSPERPWKNATTYGNHYIAGPGTHQPEQCQVKTGMTKTLFSLQTYDESKATEAQKQRGESLSIPALMEGWPTAAIFVRARIDTVDSIPGWPDDGQIRTPNLGDRRFTPALIKLTRLGQELGADMREATDEAEVRAALTKWLDSNMSAHEKAVKLLGDHGVDVNGSTPALALTDALAGHIAELQQSATKKDSR